MTTEILYRVSNSRKDMSMKHKKYISFPAKITIFIASFLTMLFIMISVMFFLSRSQMKQEAYKRLDFSANEISTSIDDTILNIYSVSDTFAADSRLVEYTKDDFTGKPIEKRKTTVQITNQLFASYDLLQHNSKMVAFYNQKGELFNFLDPNNADEACKQKLNELDINNKDKLARFFWYSVRDNFFRLDKTQDIRSDMAVIGSRRVFSRTQNSYVGVHIFALSEETLYNQYKSVADEYNADIYVIDSSGNLFSSSNIEALKSGEIDKNLCSLVLNRTYDRFNYGNNVVSVGASHVNDWLVVICAPISSVTAVIDKLYNWIFWLIFAAVIFASVMIYVIYKRFMSPISKLNASMQRAHDGDLSAYVSDDSNNELGQMIDNYNALLSSINYNIKEKLSLDKHKRELEMEVLMNQINPHFLYNTLETIVWKSSEAGRPDIGRIAASLGHMYRLSVAQGSVFVSIKHELEHVNTYIKIQKNRYQDKFVFETRADNNALISYYTPKILIQPIVENSLSYGMDGLNRQLQIRISVHILENSIRIQITDNGNGMNREELSAVREQLRTGIKAETKKPSMKKSTGLGLHNIYERLRIYLNAEDPITILSKKNWGTSVIIILPKITGDIADTWNKN